MMLEIPFIPFFHPKVLPQSYGKTALKANGSCPGDEADSKRSESTWELLNR